MTNIWKSKHSSNKKWILWFKVKKTVIPWISNFSTWSGNQRKVKRFKNSRKRTFKRRNIPLISFRKAKLSNLARVPTVLVVVLRATVVKFLAVKSVFHHRMLSLRRRVCLLTLLKFKKYKSNLKWFLRKTNVKCLLRKLSNWTMDLFGVTKININLITVNKFKLRCRFLWSKEFMKNRFSILSFIAKEKKLMVGWKWHP